MVRVAVMPHHSNELNSLIVVTEEANTVTERTLTPVSNMPTNGRSYEFINPGVLRCIARVAA